MYEGSKGYNFLYLNYFGEPILGYFSARAVANCVGAECGIVSSNERSQVEGMARLAVTRASHTEARKMVVSCSCITVVGTF